MKFIRSLRKFQKNIHGVSVIVGALMLTLIVVTAAVSFAVFTAQKQEELQKQEFARLLREQEDLEVVKIVDLAYDSAEKLLSIGFSVVSQHIRSSDIVALKINGNVVKDFYVTDMSNQHMYGWTLAGGYCRTAYFANDSSGNLYVFDDLNGNHKVDTDELLVLLDTNPNDGAESNPKEGDQGYLYAKDNNGEYYLFNDADFDGSGTGSPFENVSAGDKLASFTETDNVFSEKRGYDTEVVWIENGTNNWYNTTNDEDILLLNLTGNPVGDWTSNNVTGTNVASIPLERILLLILITKVRFQQKKSIISH